MSYVFSFSWNICGGWVCVCTHALWACRLQCKMFLWLGLKSLAWWSLKAFPLQLYLILPGDNVLIIHLEHKGLLFFPLLLGDWAKIKKHLHNSPGLKQRNLWSLGGNLGKVPAIKAQKLSLCEGLPCHDSSKLAWRLVPRARDGMGNGAQVCSPCPRSVKTERGRAGRVRAALMVPTKRETTAQPLMAKCSAFAMEPA